MSKKYVPSGYQIIDLSEYGELAHGDNIDLTTSEDGKALLEMCRKRFPKPILLKGNFDEQIITVVPTLRVTDDNYIYISFIYGTYLVSLGSDGDYNEFTSLTIDIKTLSIEE